MNKQTFTRLLELGKEIADDAARAEHNALLNELANAAGVPLSESGGADAEDRARQREEERAQREAQREAERAAREAEAAAKREEAARQREEERAQREAERAAREAEAAARREEAAAKREEESRLRREASSGSIGDSGESNGSNGSNGSNSNYDPDSPEAAEAFSREIAAAKTRISTGGGKNADMTQPEIVEVYCKIRSDYHPHNWMWLGYSGSEGTLSVYGSGTGGHEEMMNVFEQYKGEPLYGYLRYIFGDTDRAKFLFFTYVPDALPGLRKMKVQNHKGSVDSFFKYYHVGIPAFSKQELAEKVVVEKLKKAGGADYGTGQGGGSRGTQNFGTIKNQSKTFYAETDKKTELKNIVFQKGPLTTTPCDLSGRPMVAPPTEVKKNTNLVGNLDAAKIASKK